MTQAATSETSVDWPKQENRKVFINSRRGIEEVRSLPAGREPAAGAEVGPGVLPAWGSARCPRRARTFLRRGLAVQRRLALTWSLPGPGDLSKKDTRVTRLDQGPEHKDTRVTPSGPGT